jgi:hypothetical protein
MFGRLGFVELLETRFGSIKGLCVIEFKIIV